MKVKFALIVSAVLLAGPVSFAHAQAVIAFSFICNGKTFGSCPQGRSPNSLIQASDGNFYGTAANSGDQSNGHVIFGGTVFSLTPAGKFKLLHTFTAGTNSKYTNGATPISLTEGPDGKLYGLTSQGGNDFGGQFFGYGVVFRINKNGSGFQVIHRFCSTQPYCIDGSYSAGPLLAGSDGNIYGVTNEGGGGSGCAAGGCGEIFRVTPSTATYEAVLSFTSSDAGGFPVGMIAGPDGTFYGLTIEGNALFQYTPATGAFQSTTLAFPVPAGCPGDACFATNAFAFGTNGDLYGFYTVYDEAGSGGLFDVQTDGTNLQLFSEFTTTLGPGVQLLLGSDGNLWAPQTTGSSKFGNILTLSPSDGTLIQTLSPFSSTVFAPVEIIEANDGKQWGVGSGGVVASGHFGGGTLFNVNAGLPKK